MLSFIAILLTALTAFFGAPWWIIAVGGTAIAIVSIGDHRHARQQLSASTFGGAVAREAIAVSVAHATAAAAAAYVLGFATRLIVAA
jgi:hypothetical protein